MTYGEAWEGLEHWLQVCTSDEGGLQLACIGFIKGVAEFHRLQPAAALYYCPPPTITVGQEKAIIVKYMQNNPQKLHLPFVRLLLDALGDAFPCPARSN